MPGRGSPGKRHMRYDDGDEAPLQQKAYRAVRVWRSDLRTALVFLTRVPLKAARPEGDSPPLSRAVRAFPIVGALIGLFAGIVYAIGAGIGLPDIVAAVLADRRRRAHHRRAARGRPRRHGGRLRRRKHAGAQARDHAGQPHRRLRRDRTLVVVLAAKVGAIADLERDRPRDRRHGRRRRRLAGGDAGGHALAGARAGRRPLRRCRPPAVNPRVDRSLPWRQCWPSVS